MATPTDDCEAALAAHWSQLGRLPGCRLHDGDALWFETPVRHLPYNGVVRTRLAGAAGADEEIARIAAHFRSREAQFWWAVHPSATPQDLAERLAAAGLEPVERMNFMSLELAEWQPPAAPDGVTVTVAEDEDALRAYRELTFAYWEIPAEEQEAVARLHRSIVPGEVPGERYLALAGGRPVGKAYLSFPGPPGVASLYGMSVLPEARGRGVACALTTAMMVRAKELGCHRAVLHATDMAVGVYRRAGFTRCGYASVFATAPLWTEEH